MRRYIHLAIALALTIGCVSAWAGGEEEEFAWSWEKDGQATGGAAVAAGDLPKAAAAGVKGVDPAQYNKLLKENLDLRNKTAAAVRAAEASGEENERLSARVKDLELKTAKTEAAAGAETKSAADPDKVVDLEARLAASEAEKAKLANELAAAQPKADAAAGEGAADAVKPGSDLFRELEKENASLKEKLAKLEADKLAAVQELTSSEAAAAQSEDLKQAVATAEVSQEKRKELIAGLARRVLTAEQELKAKDKAIEEKDRSMAALKAELDRREQRLQKMERLAVLLARTRTDVQGADERERSDLHYNMAVVYAGKGQYEDAEREYLNAVRTDPTDADAHFNLGILYEEIFKNKDKAALHYRRFLKLKPDSAEAIQVRAWLLHVETR